MMNWLVPKAHAASGNWATLLTPGSGASTGTIEGTFNAVIDIIILVASALAVIYLIYSGILYITAAGNPDAAKKGQQGVINAIIGIVIIAAAYFIIKVALGLAGTFAS